MCRSLPHHEAIHARPLDSRIGLARRRKLIALVEQFETGVINRRAFVRLASASCGTGIAAALLAACTIPPAAPPALPAGEGTGTAGSDEVSARGLETTLATYGEYEGQTLQGHLALPGGMEPAPAILVIQEWWGLNPHIKDVANRFAQAGYVALVPDLYHGEVATEPTEARKLAMALDRGAALAELDVAARYLLDLEATTGDRVGIIGFCLGGGIAQAFAAQNELNGAAISFYGAPLSDAQAAQVHGALLTIWGSEDRSFPIPRTEQLEAALNAAQIPNRRIVYEGAGHAFFNDTRASYHPEAAEDAWQQSLDWLSTYLAG